MMIFIIEIEKFHSYNLCTFVESFNKNFAIIMYPAISSCD